MLILKSIDYVTPIYNTDNKIGVTFICDGENTPPDMYALMSMIGRRITITSYNDHDVIAIMQKNVIDKIETDITNKNYDVKSIDSIGDLEI